MVSIRHLCVPKHTQACPAWTAHIGGLNKGPKGPRKMETSIKTIECSSWQMSQRPNRDGGVAPLSLSLPGNYLLWCPHSVSNALALTFVSTRISHFYLSICKSDMTWLKSTYPRHRPAVSAVWIPCPFFFFLKRLHCYVNAMKNLLKYAKNSSKSSRS